jgi:hypothetical protein
MIGDRAVRWQALSVCARTSTALNTMLAQACSQMSGHDGLLVDLVAASHLS